MSNRYEGAGNSFLIFEDKLPKDPAVLCECGVDGVLLLQGRCYRIFNADGSEAEMCGNGVRCMVRYLEDRGRKQERYFFDSLAGPIEAWHEGDLIGVKMPAPRLVKRTFFKNKEADFYLVGVPHIVLFFDDIENIEIEKWADPAFNVNLVQVNGDSISVRTFERGVNRETLSCGTGAVASAASVKNHFDFPEKIVVKNRSQSDLIIRLLPNRTEMVGPASLVVNYSSFN